MTNMNIKDIYSRIKSRNTLFYKVLIFIVPLKLLRHINQYLGIYPSAFGDEIREIKQVLVGPHWNITSANSRKHIELEAQILKYTNSSYAVAVSSGGVGIQMVLRALGLAPGELVGHQVDTCNAVPQSILNSHQTPFFLDISKKTHMLDTSAISNLNHKSPSTLIATHMWGYHEDVDSLLKIKEFNLIEDCCLALGLKRNGVHVGNQGIAGVFSFGASKPMQAGEGGIIVTNSKDLDKELRIIRNWGESIGESRDLKKLSLNGRISETTSAIILSQLKMIDDRILRVRENVRSFFRAISESEIFSPLESLENTESVYTRIVLKINRIKLKKEQDSSFIIEQFRKSGIGAFYANFEPVNQQTFFQNESWVKWCHELDEFTKTNNSKIFLNAQEIFEFEGFSLPQECFRTKKNLNKTIDIVRKLERFYLK